MLVKACLCILNKHTLWLSTFGKMVMEVILSLDTAYRAIVLVDDFYLVCYEWMLAILFVCSQRLITRQTFFCCVEEVPPPQLDIWADQFLLLLILLEICLSLTTLIEEHSCVLQI